MKVVSDASYIDDYLSLEKTNDTHIKSFHKTWVEITKNVNKNVHVYLWFTNLPRVDDEEHKKSPGGITKIAVVCTKEKTVLIRGPDREDLETAGVSQM